MNSLRLSQDPYRTNVTYDQPGPRDLWRRFHFHGDSWERGRLEFRRDREWLYVPGIPRELGFEIVTISRASLTTDVLGLLQSLRLRPALYEEGLSFDAAFPRVRLQQSYVCLGSVRDGVGRIEYPVFLSGHGTNQHLSTIIDPRDPQARPDVRGRWPIWLGFLGVHL